MNIPKDNNNDNNNNIYLKSNIHLLFQCDILFVEEHWLLSSKLHLLQNISDEFIVISKSGMNDHELLSGRPYGGTAIFLRKNFKLYYNQL